jgi:hypothetical protein
MRCVSSFQDVYRAVAARNHCILVDGQALFHAVGKKGLLDDHLFHDAVHPSLLGQIALAQGILNALRERKALGWPDSSRVRPIDPRECAAHFGLIPSDWKALAERGRIFYFTVSSLRYDPEMRIAKQQAFGMAAQRIARGDPPESLGLPNIGIPPGLAQMRGKPQSSGSDAD